MQHQFLIKGVYMMAVDHPLNRYVDMPPDAAEHEKWQTGYKAIAWVIAIAVAVAAVAANVFIGITNPTFSPIAAISTIAALQPALQAFSYLYSLAEEEGRLAIIDHGIDQELQLCALNDDLSNVRARYMYWSRRATALLLQEQQALARPENVPEGYENTPEGKLFHRGQQLRALEKRQEACVAKVRAAYFLHILSDEHFQPDLEQAIPLNCMPAERRMIERGLAEQFHDDADESFVLKPDHTPIMVEDENTHARCALSLQKVKELSENDLERAIFAVPR